MFIYTIKYSTYLKGHSKANTLYFTTVSCLHVQNSLCGMSNNLQHLSCIKKSSNIMSTNYCVGITVCFNIRTALK